MRPLIATLLLAFSAVAADRPWQQITVPATSDAAANFSSPPAEYGMVLWWFWNGQMAESDIVRDLDDMHSHGVSSVMIWAYYGLEIDYLSDTWFARVQFAVAQARERGMRVWLMDEGSYPSGFAGGAFTRDHPDQRMKALVATSHGSATGGKPVALNLPAEALAAWAVERTSKSTVTLDIVNGKLNWTPPPGTWDITSADWQYRTPATRYVNNPGFPKNTQYSAFDFLDADATRTFLAIVHERYQSAIGDEFGKTVMGFMGDEPDCVAIPWTAQSFDEFQSRKGYDLRPQMSSLLASSPTASDRRVQADYSDVWSALYRENFFRVQADWCAANGLEYIVHLNNDDNLNALVPLAGDYFRDMRYVQVPGVDAIWRQIWPGTVADYPKLASSAAHLNGRPRAFSESFAVYGRGLTIEQAKWVMDYEFVRGINLFECMLMLSDSSEFREYFHPPDWRGSPQWDHFPALAQYSNRASYLLSIGTPAARVALFSPTASLWLGNAAANQATYDIARRLLETQRDFDFIDEQALAQPAGLGSDGLRNQSGQLYGTVVVPPGSVLSGPALATLHRFSDAGGVVIFAGSKPGMAYDTTFRDAYTPAIDWGIVDPDIKLDALGPSDVSFAAAAPSVKTLHRRWQDADLYFFFNESDSALDVTATLEGTGRLQDWDPGTGVIQALASQNPAAVGLHLDPYGSRFVVIGTAPPGLIPAPVSPTGQVTTVAVPGPWELRLDTLDQAIPLKSWSDLGRSGYSGAGLYRTKFRSNFVAGTPLTLDLGEVLYSAHVWVNGFDLGVRAWRPFRWDITADLKPGDNEIEVEVRNTAANELSGDAANLAAVQAKGWLQGSYFSTYSPFDAQMVPSGLMGPVQIEGVRVVARRRPRR
jgi:hypothetical protein